MSFTDPGYPEDHPISLARARELMAGDYADVCRGILKACTAPFFWHAPGLDGRRRICSNGTMTFVQTQERIIGVTAAHVLAAYWEARGEAGVAGQLMGAPFDPEVIDYSPDLDLATVAITPELVTALGKDDVIPVSMPRLGDVPLEGRGIMLCGYPGEDRIEEPGMNVDWGLFTVLGVARRVNEKQITWVPDRGSNVPTQAVRPPPSHKDLGGISGGPLIAWFEKGAWTYYSIAAVVVEANATLESVAAMRVEVIRPDGRLIGA